MKYLRSLLNVGSVIIPWYDDGDVKLRDHCHITAKYRGSAHWDCNIDVKSNYKILFVFHNLKIYKFHFIIQELGHFNLKRNMDWKNIPNGLEKYMSFNISSKLVFYDSFQLLSSSLNSLVKNFGKNDFKYLSQDFNSNVVWSS